jgi:hypothetical protein
MKDLRFDWYPSLTSPQIEERLGVLLEELLKDYKAGSGIKPKSSYEVSYSSISKHLLSALYCAYHAGERVSLPRRTGAYGVGKTGRIQYSFRDARKVHETLLNKRWISIDEEGAKGKYTLVSASGDLARAFEEWGLLWMLPNLLPEKDCVALRDVKRDAEAKPIRSGRKKKTTKLDLEVPKSSLVTQHRSNLTYINNKLRQHCISLDVSNEHLLQLQKEMAKRKNGYTQDTYRSLHFQRVQLTRIFSRGSMELGGRFYRGWWQGLPSIHRPHIRIDGKKTVEVDYSGMSLRIIYALAEQDMDTEADPYDIGLDNWQGPKDHRRKKIKQIVNALINDEDGVYVIPKKDLKLLKVTEDDFRLLLAQKHPLIENELSSGIGLKTQYIDSQIAEAVMLELLEQDVVVLPVHDSFIVPAGYQSALEASMKYHFNLLTGSTAIVEAEVVKTDDHYGMTAEKVLQLQAMKDESVGVVAGGDTWELVVGDRERITTKYLTSWEQWLASDVPATVSPLRETT